MRILSVFFVLALTLFFDPISATPSLENWKFNLKQANIAETHVSNGNQNSNKSQILLKTDSSDCFNMTTTEVLWETVGSISSQIEKAISLNKDNVLDLYNRRGIAYLFLEEYDKALNDFALILKASDNGAFNQSERCLMGAGLWGTFFCHACQNLEELALEDFRLIEIYFLRDQPCAQLSGGILDKSSFEFITTESLSSDYFDVYLTANFADSNNEKNFFLSV